MKKSRRIATLAVGAALLLSLDAWAQSSEQATAEAAIRAADAAWSKAAGTGNADAIVAYYADDATVMAPNAPMANDKAAIGKLWRDMVATPGFALSWQATQVDAAPSGDMGYSIGTYQSSMNDAKGKPSSDHGKYATVWRRQADGSWKVVVDIFNTDMPAAAK